MGVQKGRLNTKCNYRSVSLQSLFPSLKTQFSKFSYLTLGWECSKYCNWVRFGQLRMNTAQLGMVTLLFMLLADRTRYSFLDRDEKGVLGQSIFQDRMCANACKLVYNFIEMKKYTFLCWYKKYRVKLGEGEAYKIRQIMMNFLADIPIAVKIVSK